MDAVKLLLLRLALSMATDYTGSLTGERPQGCTGSGTVFVAGEVTFTAPTGTNNAADDEESGACTPCFGARGESDAGGLSWEQVNIAECTSCFGPTNNYADWVYIMNDPAGGFQCQTYSCQPGTDLESYSPTYTSGTESYLVYMINKDCSGGGGGAAVEGDPHLYGAHGDRADVRGVHATTYNILSARDISVGLTTRNADFKLPRQLVHGSFFTEAHFVLRTKESGTKESGEIVRVFSNASSDATRFLVMVGLDSSISKGFGRHRTFVHEDIKVESKEVKLVVTAADWEVTLTRRKVNEPLVNSIQFRFDVAMRPLKRDFVVWPHGILGQTFDGDSVAVDGKMDSYHMAGPEFTTSAMAQGFIEGTVEDYVLADPSTPHFKYSRFFLHEATPPRDVSKLTGTRRVVAPAAVGVNAGSTEEEGQAQ